MNTLTSHFTHSLYVRLPINITREAVLSALHDHVGIIKLNPLVISYEKTAIPTVTPSAPTWDAAYIITDQIYYLPFQMWKGEVSYKACFHDTANGLDSRSDAALGFVAVASWQVKSLEEVGHDTTFLELEPTSRSEHGADETPLGDVVLVETAQISCPSYLKPFVQNTLKGSHEKLCRALVERLNSTK